MITHYFVNPIKPRGGGVILARGKFKLKSFLNDLWYEPETLWLSLTFTRDYFAEKRNWKNIKFSGGNIFLYRGYCQQIGVQICKNSFSSRNKYVSSLFILVYEGNTYNLLVQRNYFQRQSPVASLQKYALQTCSKFTVGDPYGNVISKKIA